jgi:hypothetical protein
MTSKAQTPAPATDAPEGAYGIAALVEATGAQAKDVRRWLRSQVKSIGAGDTLPGKGGRYAFTSAQVSALAGAYAQAKARKGTTASAEALTASLTASATAGVKAHGDARV